MVPGVDVFSICVKLTHCKTTCLGKGKWGGGKHMFMVYFHHCENVRLL